MAKANLPKAKGKAAYKVLTGTSSVADGGSITVDVGHADFAAVETKVADHIASVESVTDASPRAGQSTIVVALYDMSTPGTPAAQSSAKDVQYLVVGHTD